MRYSLIVCAVLILAGEALSQNRQIVSPQPNQFEIGRRTFFDFGPPFNYYELFIVRPAASRASIDRIIVTPPGNACLAPAKVEIAHASINESPSSLLGSRNLCSIPEKELQRELKRCKNCLVFSGANVVMRVQCGTQTRLIRSDILDRDMFDPAAKTPEHTSSTMRLLKRLDDASGPGVMEKPMFAIPDEGKPQVMESDSVALQDLAAGKYDELFKGAPDKPSDLYRAAQNLPAAPSVRLLTSVPFAPEVSVLPKYPALARAASIEGQVTFTAETDSSGGLTNVAFVNGHRLLQAAVQEALNTWKFPKEALNQQIHGTIEFLLNCHASGR
jgi:TonB family protein